MLGATQNAVADCTVTFLPNMVTCGTTHTVDQIFPIQFTDRDRVYLFPFSFGKVPAGNVTGNVTSGATVDGFGLAIVNNSPPGEADINFINAGNITLTTNVPQPPPGTADVGGTAALDLISPGGNITYSGNGNVSSGNFSTDAIDLRASNGTISFGTSAAPITGSTIAGNGTGTGLSAIAGGNIGIFLSGSTIVGANGISAVAGGNIGIFLSGGSVTGTVGDGILALQNNPTGTGNIAIQADSVINGNSANPGGIGIQATNLGTGGITIANAGTVNGLSAISAFSASGNVALSNSGTANATDGFDIGVQTKSGNVAVSNSGTVTGFDAVVVESTSGNVTVSNSGTVNATSQAITVSTGGNVDVSNSGTVNGAILAFTNGNVDVSNGGNLTGSIFLGGATATFNNNGTWNATGASSFSGPSNVNNNVNGVINISGPTDITLGAASTFTNNGSIFFGPLGSSIIATITASTFNNSGLINLATGTATNQLTLVGNFTGLHGSTLNVSVNPAGGSADQLIIKGTATGTTSVFANYLGSPKFVTTPIPVVTASPGSTGTFSLVDPSFGLIEYFINQSGGLLSSGLSPTGLPIATATPAAVAATQLTINGIETQLRQRRDQIQCYSPSGITSACNAAHAMSYQDVVSSYQQENTKQDPATDAIAMAVKAPPAPPAVQDLGSKPGVWVQAFDDWQRLDVSAMGTNLGTKQNTYGFQGGFDETWRNLLGSGDALVLGLVGGYTQASVHFDAGIAKANLSGPGFGGYWTYINGGFSTDGVVKNDWFGLTDDDLINGSSSSANVQNFSVTGNAQYKFAVLTNSFIEPTAGFVYTQTSYSDVPATLNTLVNGHTTRVQGGARFATAWDYNGIHFEPTLLGLVYDNVQVTGTPLQSIGFVVPTDEGKVRGEFDLVLNADFGKGFSGFAEGDVRFGDDLLGGTVKVGLRKQW